MNPRRLRELAGAARYRVAARAGVSDTIARVYEANRGAVSAPVRATLDAAYGELHEHLRAQLTDLGPWPPEPNPPVDTAAQASR